MIYQQIPVVLLVCVLVIVQALPHWNKGQLRYDHGQTFEMKHFEEQKAPNPYDYYLNQKLDHFDRANLQTFEQRYFINTTYWKGPESGAPVFLCVGGEGPPLTWKVLVASDHCNDMVELAPKHGALMLALEHRYYGPSTPNGDYSTENLRFLNSEQALGDIAYFHKMMSLRFGLSSTNKWVSWGGSYPGMMAAMARLRYPHLFHASVSSSSPLQAQVNMEEYNEVVANSVSAEIVGGSQQCLDVVVEGHKTIGDMLQTQEGRSELESMFNICVKGTLEDEKNREQFAGDGVVYIPAQSNDPACEAPLCNIEKVCTLLTDETLGTPLDRLATLHSKQSGGACTPANYNLMIKGLSNPSNPERSWLYQTCNEWGFYQTCPVGSKCPYTQGLHTLNVDFDICQQAFNITPISVSKNIEYANAMYGGNKIQGTRIMYPNGQIDPWSALGVLESPNSQQPVLWVEGASHHFWTHESLPTDSDFVVQARHTIWNQVDAWLAEDN